MTFLLGGMLFEDVGVTAYAVAAPLVQKKEHLEAAAGILAVEASHMGRARSQTLVTRWMVRKRWARESPSKRAGELRAA
ncbi:ferritin-like domain-containing protein (plasmid) [Ensifer sp. D2-11]